VRCLGMFLYLEFLLAFIGGTEKAKSVTALLKPSSQAIYSSAGQLSPDTGRVTTFWGEEMFLGFSCA
jgi:hypothetical protein